jgi:hypothetical protein
MDNLNAETESALRKLAGEIGVANDLDPEIQEELYGHLEDKTLGYLSGEESLSQGDALLLTREHFGDRRMLREFLSQVHYASATVHLGRRLAAAAVLLLALGLILKPLRAAGLVLSSYASVAVSQIVTPLVTFALCCLFVVSYFMILRRWRVQLKSEREPWFERWSAQKLLAVLVSMLLFNMFAVLPLSAVTAGTASDSVLERVMASVIGILVLAIPMIWAWWADTPPRRIHAVLTGVCAWLALSLAQNMLGLLLGNPTIWLTDSGMRFELRPAFFFPETELVGLDYLAAMASAFRTVAGFHVAMGGLAAALYIAGSAIGRRVRALAPSG